MPKYVQDEQGNVYEDLGKGRGRPVSQEELAAASDNPLQTFGKAAAVSAGQAYGGIRKLLGDQDAQRALDEMALEQQAYGNINPVAQALGSAAPAVAVGLGTAGLGAIPTVAAEAAMGAAYSPDNPLMGAGIGAAAGALPFGAMAAGRYAVQNAPRIVQRVGDAISDPLLNRPPGLGMAAGGPITPPIGSGITQRVVGAIDDAIPTAPPGQYYKGLMRSSQLDEAGVPLTPAMRTALDAPNAEVADYAKKMLWREGLQGIGEQERRGQRMYLTNLVKNEMGVMDDVALTDTVIGEVLKTEGKNIGRILSTDANLALPVDSIMAMRGVVETAETGWQSSLANVVKNIENSVARNGTLTPQAYQNAITKLGEIGAPGRSAGAIQDVKKLRDILSGHVEGTLAPAQKQLLAEARYRYKIAKTLKQGQGVGGDMMVNPKTFGSNWDRKMAQTARGQDKIGQAADTMNFLSTMEANAGTTLQRNIANLPQLAGQMAPPAIGAAIGVPALGAGWNALFGQ